MSSSGETRRSNFSSRSGFWCVSFPALAQIHRNVFLACEQRWPLLHLLSVRGPSGTAPVDSCGHDQETSAPNLQNGSLPTQVRVRARAVSNPLNVPSFMGLI